MEKLKFNRFYYVLRILQEIISFSSFSSFYPFPLPLAIDENI